MFRYWEDTKPIQIQMIKNGEFYDCNKENVLHNGADHARIGTWVFKSKPTSLVKKEVVVNTTKKTKKTPKFKNKI